ncbi:MAG: hypothetical protein EPN82_13085 [Bacteroidetes bacterium]|nr:MAG: hypothetical protein EPN82_13085 [Bacteroidota bacterium]
MRYLNYFIRTVFVIISIILLSCTKSDELEKTKTIKIGVILPLTGDIASWGKKGQNAIELAIEKINSNGGINGVRIEALYEDDKGSPQVAVNAVSKLIYTNKVPAIVGGIISAVTLSVAPIAEKNKVILIATTSSAPAITFAGDYIYRVWPSDLLEGSALGKFAKEKGFKRAVLLHLNNDYGISIAKIFKKNFESIDSKILADEGYQETNTDYRSILTKAKLLNPDVIYTAGYYEDCARLIKQARELGIESQFLGVTAIEDDKYIQIAGSSAEGVIYPLATGFDLNSKDTIIQKFIQNFRKKYNYDPGWVESHCYDAFMLVYKALCNSKYEITGTKIKNYLDNMGIYHGVTGIIKFDKNGDVIKPVKFKTIQNGKFENLEK